MSSTSESVARCAACGKLLTAGAAFCRGCGTPVSPLRPAPSPPPTQAPPPLPRAQPQQGLRGWVKPALIAALVGLLVGGGAVAAIVVLGGDSGQSSVPTSDGASTVPAGEAGSLSSGEASSGSEASATASGYPSEDRAQMASEIQTMLLAFHEDLAAGRFRDAWSLQSARKRDQYLEEQGYGRWKRNQATLSPYLSPGGLTVRVDGLEGEGVARVLVTGMGWSKPGASCGEWSGLTWVKYERGAWFYDPGYSTTFKRERTWKPRYDELLGAGC